MLYKYQLKIVRFYNIPINNVKKRLTLTFFVKEKYVLDYEKL